MDRKMREQFYQIALTVWAEYQASGEHVTQQEADIWFARLEAGEDVPPSWLHD
jgi:predicted transcriptional regulator